MLTEDDVVLAVCRYVRRHGYRIVSRCFSFQSGEDIVATGNKSGVTIRIEAKGGTSAKPSTRRFGKAFSASHCEAQVANAFYTAAAMAAKHGREHNQRFGIAVPESWMHRRCLQRIEPALKKLRITVFWVWENGKVQVEGARVDGLADGTARRTFDPIRSSPPEGARRAQRRAQRLAEPRRRGFP